MIPLVVRGTPLGIEKPIIAKVIRDAEKDRQWPSRVFVGPVPSNTVDVPSFSALISEEPLDGFRDGQLKAPLVHSVPTAHLNQGDVVRIDPDGVVRTLYRRGSPHNTLFATERCNSFCVMCSQPPRDVNDQWRVDEMLRTVELIDVEAHEIGISGGEPTLLDDGLLSVIRAAKDRLPNTALHILSNGRLFRYSARAEEIAAIQHQDLMFGIPVYSDLDSEHDHVVQARGAFEDTLLGLQNLGRCGVPVEIRVVIHKFTYSRLPAVAEFIYRNLTFASHVALMGLEATGFAKGNMEALWIDPADYRNELEEATLFLSARGMNVSVYNHQLCTVAPAVWPYCRKSISDWKNEYHPVCEGCSVRSECGGLFMFNLRSRISRSLRPISEPAEAASTLSVAPSPTTSP
jgi:His-Xaa-Ser system radical SAM maturase HxsC